MHESDRLVFRSAARPGDAGNRNRTICTGTLQRAPRHGGGCLGANRAVASERSVWNAKQLLFRVVGISNETAFEYVGRSGNCGERRSDKTSGARFCGGQAHSAASIKIEQA